MNFNNWLIKNLSKSSAKKYESAIKGSISGWAIEAGIIDKPLTEIRSKYQFQTIAESIQKLDIFNERDAIGHNMYSSALKKYGEFLEEISEDIENDLDDIFSDKDITDTERKAFIKSRLGQGRFREKLISYWKGCAVTRYNNVELLVASHIKPWKKSDNIERLDVFNGLLLLPNLDRAFDSGYVTFDKSGKIRVSKYFDQSNLFGIDTHMQIKLEEKHQTYLEYHRDTVFR